VGGARSTDARDEKHKILVRKRKRKRPLGRSKHRWEDNIRTDLREMVLQSVDRSIWLRKENSTGLL